MSEQGSNGSKAYVTNAELDAKLDKLPSRWEVRFLILAGMIASQVVPASDVAHAAIRMLP
jgi:hypothetical protein